MEPGKVLCRSDPLADTKKCSVTSEAELKSRRVHPAEESLDLNDAAAVVATAGTKQSDEKLVCGWPAEAFFTVIVLLL